jgi:hypothetical protein
MTEYSLIEVTISRNQYTGTPEYTGHKLVGNSPLVKVSGQVLHDMGVKKSASKFCIGPFRLRILEIDYCTDTATCIVENAKYSRLVALTFGVSKFFRIAYSRTLYTLAVWDLLDYNPSIAPSWRDIKIVKYFHLDDL